MRAQQTLQLQYPAGVHIDTTAMDRCPIGFSVLKALSCQS